MKDQKLKTERLEKSGHDTQVLSSQVQSSLGSLEFQVETRFQTLDRQVRSVEDSFGKYLKSNGIGSLQ